MNPKFNSREMHEFFNNFEERNAAYILGLIVISLGLYIFTWIYSINKDLENLDDNAPSSTRGAILMVALPFTWFFIMTYVKEITSSILIEFLEVTVYIILYVLVMKFLYEFCLSFAHVTRTRPIFWFASFLVGSLGFFAYYLQLYVFVLFLLVLILVIPAMQAELNVTYHKISIKKNNFSFYG